MLLDEQRRWSTAGADTALQVARWESAFDRRVVPLLENLPCREKTCDWANDMIGPRVAQGKACCALRDELLVQFRKSTWLN